METIPLFIFKHQGKALISLQSYLDHLHHQKTRYPADFIRVLDRIVSDAALQSIDHAESWDFKVDSQHQVDPGTVSTLCAEELMENSSMIAASRDCQSLSIHSYDNERQRVWTHDAGKIAAEIVYLRGLDPSGVGPFPRWDATSVTQTVETKSRASTIIGSIPVPSQHAENGAWRTINLFSSDLPAYSSIFSQSGAIGQVKLAYGGQVFSWHVFGVSLQLVWPPSTRNIEAAQKNPPEDYCNPDLWWCFRVLSDLKVFFVKPTVAKYRATKVECGSWSTFLAFSPSHCLNMELYSSNLYNEVFKKLDTGNPCFGRGKALWKAFFRSVGQLSVTETEEFSCKGSTGLKRCRSDPNQQTLDFVPNLSRSQLPSFIEAGTSKVLMQQSEEICSYEDNLHIESGSSPSLTAKLTCSRSNTLYLVPTPGHAPRSDDSAKAMVNAAKVAMLTLMKNMHLNVYCTTFTEISGLNDLEVNPEILHALRPSDVWHWKSAFGDVWRRHLFHLHSFQGFDFEGHQCAKMRAQDKETFERLGVDAKSAVKSQHKYYLDSDPQDSTAGQKTEISLYFPRMGVSEEFPIKILKRMTGRKCLWSPLNELRDSVEVMIRFYISDPASESVMARLQQYGRDSNNLDQFLKVVNDANILIKRTYTCPMHTPQSLSGGIIPYVLVQLIMDNSYWRLISNKIGNETSLRRGTYGWNNSAYGEIMPLFVQDILQGVVSPKEGEYICDVGSGISAVGLHIALQSGAQAFCIEIRKELHKLGLQYQELVNAYCSRWKLPTPNCTLSHGDVLKDLDFQQQLFISKLIIMNNFAFDPKLCLALASLIENGCCSHTFILTTKELPWKVQAVVKPLKENFLDWKSEGYYYIYELNRPC